MSEIKGQLLGMVLVLAIFAVVGGVLYGVFKNTADKIDQKVTSAVEKSYTVTDYIY